VPRVRARGGLLIAAWMAAVASLAVAEDVRALTVKGSDTIGQHLGQDLARAYAEREPGVRVRWESIGSGTAFTGLLDGTADLGASSRAIRPDEIARAQELGLRLQEFVIGYDGIAVISHPSNPVEELSSGQLSALIGGQLTRWSEVGGRDGPVHLISRPSYSGTHGFFKDTVLAPRGMDFGPGTAFLEETDAIVEAVGQDPTALAYVGLGFVTGRALRVLRIRAEEGDPAVAPSEASIRSGAYVIHRPLFLYVRERAPRPVWALLEFVLSAEARPYVTANQFIPTDVVTRVVRPAEALPDVAAAPPARALRAPLRIRFGFNRAALGPNGRAALEPLIDRLRRGERTVHITGHADAIGPSESNAAVAEARARAVAAYLMGRGVPAEHIHIDARGAEEPIASNDTLAGRRANRRVDVRVVSE